jgi:hypothetical protein
MTEPPEDIPPQRLRTMQIVAAALPLSVVTTCAVLVSIVYFANGGQGLQQPAGLPIVSLVAAGMTLCNVPLSISLPLSQTRAAVRRIAAGSAQPTSAALQLLVVRQTTIIMADALLEGAALTCGIAYAIEGQVYVLVGVAVTVALMLANFPTANGVRAWLDRQLEAVRQAREEATAAPPP